MPQLSTTDANDVFWEDLLSHIGGRLLVPVVGPDMTLVKIGATEQRLGTLIGRRLADRYRLPPGSTTMGDAVAAFLHERGRDEIERLYRVINDIIAEVDPVPGDALRNLAAIDNVPLFVSTTPDRLLATAVNDVRFHGRPGVREVSFSPNQSTSEQSRNSEPAESTDTVVLNLFGQTSSTPQYAIHEEDRLEWLHSLLSDAASLPDWLDYPLKHHPLLFLGCEIPDWLGRFLLRMSSNSRLSLERNQQFFFVGKSISPTLSNFFATYCRRTMVQQLDMEPSEFVVELRARWERRTANRARPPLDQTDRSLGVGSTSSPSSPPTIFISYMREDADAARRLYDAIDGLGGDVWLDERQISPGDEWEKEVLARIHGTVRLFVPVISRNTEAEDEGYVFREWLEAADRSRSIPRRRFIVPVVIDDDYEGDARRYQQIPEEFSRLHFGRAPGGDPDAELLDVLTAEIRAMRRTNAA